MSMRLSACSIGLAAMLAASAGAEAGARGADSTAVPRPPLVLNIRLVSADRLPMLSRVELIRESTSIWRASNIRLNWLNNPSTPDPAGTLRVLVARKTAGASSTEDGRWVIGELLKLEDQHAMALISIGAAERVLADGRRAQFLDALADYDRGLGVVLGRAVAHEIGHYLLHTSSHAASGLMRASFAADEFADAGIDTFGLDDAARRHLQEAAAGGAAHWIEQAHNRTFSYGSAPAGYATLEVVRHPN